MTADRTAALEAAQIAAKLRAALPVKDDWDGFDPLMAEAADAIDALLATVKEADMRAFGASDEACYRWPEGTPEHKALRAAFIDGAAVCGGNAAKEADRMREALAEKAINAVCAWVANEPHGDIDLLSLTRAIRAALLPSEGTKT